MKNKYLLEATYTVEAAILLPLCLLILAILINTGISMFLDIVAGAENIRLDEMKPVELFRNLDLLLDELK